MRHAASRFAESAQRVCVHRPLPGARHLLIVVATFAVFLVLAPFASAERGIHGFFAIPPQGAALGSGTISSAKGVAVNGSGVGGVTSGAVYVGDGSNTPQVNQYAPPAGAFKFSFGRDVVASGPDNANEVQHLVIKATGGTFTLSFAGKTTGAIAYDANFSVVQSALNALESIGGTGGSVAVSGGPGDATGSNPYVVTFGGTASGINKPAITVNGGSLTGGPATGWGATINPGNVGFEKCVPGNGDICKNAITVGSTTTEGVLGGGINDINDIAVDPATGDLYVLAMNRVNKFSATGQLLRTFGFDVVASGPDDSSVNAQKSLTVKATGGTYTLTFAPPCCNPATTGPISPTAPANGPGSIEEALNNLSSIGGIGGKVTVTGGPGDATGSNPYVITFGGVLGGDDPWGIGVGTSNLTGSATVNEQVVTGGALEVCVNPIDSCKQPTNGSPYGLGNTSIGGPTVLTTVTVAPPGAPNAGDVLVADAANKRVQEFSSSGTFVRMFGWDVTKSGSDDSSTNEQQTATVKATGGNFSLTFGGQTTGAIGTGDLINTSTTVENVKTTSGAFAVGEIITGTGIPAGTTIAAIGVGSLSLSNPATSTGSSLNLTANDIEYAASAAQVEAALNALSTIGGVGGSVSVSGGPGDATGSTPYTITFGGSLGGDDLSPLGTSVVGLTSGTKTVTIGTVSNGGAFEVCTAASTCQHGVAGASPGQFDLLSGIAEDSAGVVYTVEGPEANRRVQKFTPQVGPPTLSPAIFGAVGAPNGTASSNSPVGIAIGPGNTVLVAKRFPAGAAVCADGSPSPAEVRLQELSSDGLTLIETSKPCTTDPAASGPLVTIDNATTNGLEADPGTGVAYLLDAPSFSSSSRVYAYGPAGSPAALVLNPPGGISPSSATISGTINPNGPVTTSPNPTTTTYWVEYKKHSAASWEAYAPTVRIGHGTAAVPFSVGLSGLTAKTEYDIKVVVEKPFGFAPVEEIQTITTEAGPPEINALSSKNVSASTADLTAFINALGTDTSFHFEYGTTPAYGQSTPPTDMGESLDPVNVESHIEGLKPTVYHFRVVATNALGTVTSTDQTFNFYPEDCPNNTVRQQTGSGSLPDCRAYELVSPMEAGSILLAPGGPNPPTAENPSRFGFNGWDGEIEGPWKAPNNLENGDQYISTRTPNGWQTQFIGFEADYTVSTSGGVPQTNQYEVAANSELSEYLIWDQRNYVPFLLDEDNSVLGRLPTNVLGIPNADAFATNGGQTGDMKMSDNFKHLGFSSSNYAFTPGGLTTGIGSAYHNDRDQKTVTLISKTAAGADIPQPVTDKSPSTFLKIPEISEDGSHILMAATKEGLCGLGNCLAPPRHCVGSPGNYCPPHLLTSVLYLRVNDAVTYDVSEGHAVDLQGVTDDGTTIYYTSAEQITPDDTDSSTDLFMWSESTGAVTRVSRGSGGPGGTGDTDACNASWTKDCGIEVVPHYNTPRNIGPGAPGETIQNTDTAIASSAGDIYFYSPEQFSGSKGIPGRRNLYVFRGGQIDYVATLDATRPTLRFQVTPSGSHAAFITASQLTEYDNTAQSEICSKDVFGKTTGPRCREMYTFEPGTGEIVCVSCHTDGTPPISDVAGSQDGLYMSNDGRTFFSTRDALVPADTDGILDVYEYVDGRPQLITSGIGSEEYVIETQYGETIGLIGVSASGTDVYFDTHDVLVSQDRNGAFVKFYDARTGGGFPFAPGVAPCAAADECHGSGNSSSTPLQLGSTADLRENGNVVHKGKRHKKRHKTHKRRKRGGKRQHHGGQHRRVAR